MATVNYYDRIDDIPLKAFMRIAETGDVQLLCYEGKSSEAKLIEVWESILNEYGTRDNGNKVNLLLDANKSMLKLHARYMRVKAMLSYLCYEVNQEYINELKTIGYRIDVSNTDAYRQSIEKASRKAEALITQIEIKQSEIKSKDNTGETQSFESVMAWLTSKLGFHVPDSITVGRFIEYKKLIKKNERVKETGYNQR